MRCFQVIRKQVTRARRKGRLEPGLTRQPGFTLTASARRAVGIGQYLDRLPQKRFQIVFVGGEFGQDLAVT